MLSLALPRRHFIGFNDIFDLIEQEPWKNSSAHSEGYPPYNILKVSDVDYEIELALAGWKQNELDIEVQKGELLISGTKTTLTASTQLHKGISTRDFCRKFILAENVEVKSADLIDGILRIKLVHNIPEALKPKKIAINADKQCLKG